jgi:hypothetical protein
VTQTSSSVLLPLSPYDEQSTELWAACVAVLDRYPHIRPPAPTWPPTSRRVTIPQSAVDAADVHYHLD